jgi:hypothetical protein
MGTILCKRLEQQKCDVWSRNKQIGGAEYSETPKLSQQHNEAEMHTNIYLQIEHVYLIRRLN